MTALHVGLDVGSTTVKAVVLEEACGEVLWRAYERHETRQAERTADLMDRIEAAFPGRRDDLRVAITGSGGAALAPLVGARFVQEVTAP